MSVTLELYERWKAAKGLESDAAAARILKLHPTAITPWKAGRNGSPAVIFRMAHDLGEEPTATVLLAFSEAARDAEDKRTLAKLARKLGTAVVLLLALVPYNEASSAESQKQGEMGAQSIHYAQWLLGLFRRLQAAFPAFWESSPCNPPAFAPVNP